MWRQIGGVPPCLPVLRPAATQAALNRVPVAFPATLRYQLAAANYRCLNNTLKLSLFTTLLHNLVLATPRSTPIQQLYTYAVATVARLREESSPEQVSPWDPLAIATSAQVRARSKQVMNSPLNQYYVTCMLVSRPIEDTTRYRG